MKKPSLIVNLGCCFLIGLLIGWQKTTSRDSTPPIVLERPQEYVMIADTGSGYPKQATVAAAIKKQCETTQACQAVFIAGDVIYDTGVRSVTDRQFQTKFEQPYQTIDLPFYIAYGNHDYLGCKDCYINYSELSKKWRMPAAYYEQRFGDDISFFVIDTQNFDTAQQTWLRESLEKSKVKHRVVVGHYPIETFEVTKLYEDWDGKTELQEIICHAADLYVAGHAHILEDNGQISTCPIRQLVVGGGGATIRAAADVSDGGFLAAEYGFAVLTLVDDKLSYAFFNDQAEKIHQGE